MKKKYVSTINNSVYYESDQHVDMISYSSKQVDASNEPIKETHNVDGIKNLSVRVVSVELYVIVFGIIEQGITQDVITGGTNMNSSKIPFDTN